VALLGCLNQEHWPGAGDVDDCWCVATIWAAACTDPAARRPSIPEFRRLAGDPDDGERDGGSLGEVIRGARAMWPHLAIRELDDRFEEFLSSLKRGHIASVAVWSSRLPSYLQFGFRFAHQVGAAADGGELVIMNPLARQGSRPLVISETMLRAATTDPRLGYGGNVRAAIFEEVPVAIFFAQARTGSFKIPAGRKVSGYSLAGDRVVVAKTWENQPASSARFVAVLSRSNGVSPTPLLKVASGFFAGLYVPTSQVDETFDPEPPSSCDDEVAGAIAADRKLARIVYS